MAPEPEPKYPLYDTTFTLHRLSPFYIGTEDFSNATLAFHAKRFLDILRGESLRGVRIGEAVNDDAILVRAGTLQSVQWRLLPSEAAFDADETAFADDTITALPSTGSVISIVYEKSDYTAIFLPSQSRHESTAADEQFKSFPLLLTRLPTTLRETLLTFLSSTFDTRASSLKLTSPFLISTLEKHISTLVSPSADETINAAQSSALLKRSLKDIVVTLSFPTTVSLKAVDITISKEDLWKFLIRGRKLAQTPGMQGTEWPFMLAVKHYIKGHLALDISHEDIRVSRIACGAFVLGSEGKAKLFTPSLLAGEELGLTVQGKALREMVESLVGLAEVTRLSAGG
jgi:hypothetical protein